MLNKKKRFKSIKGRFLWIWQWSTATVATYFNHIIKTMIKLFWLKCSILSKSVLCIFQETGRAQNSLPNSKTFTAVLSYLYIYKVTFFDSVDVLQEMLSWKPFLGRAVVFPSLVLSVPPRDPGHPLCRWWFSCLCQPSCGRCWIDSVHNCFCFQLWS